MNLRLATRGSALARVQTDWVAARLRELAPDLTVEIVAMTTQGDRAREVPLTEMGGKGVFVSDLQRALLAGEADAAVHSLKDMTGEEPPELGIAAVPAREDPRDALVLPAGAAGDTTEPLPLPEHARVGNSSLRRRAQLLRRRPDLRVDPIRGNIDTRLRKLDAGEFDAIVLAAAGLRRLGLQERISRAFDPEQIVPAPGQGALAIEARRDSPFWSQLAALEDPNARHCVEVERALMARLQGGCLAPVGVYASLRGERLRLTAMVALPDGSQQAQAGAEGPAATSTALAEQVAQRILEGGGAEIMAAIRQAA